MSDLLHQLFTDWYGSPPDSVRALPPSGSERRYFRLAAGDTTAIGVLNPDLSENRAFIGFTRHFWDLDLPVPELYAVAADESAYLQQDLGDQTLLQLLQAKREELGDPTAFPGDIRRLYKQSLTELARMQVVGGRDLDYSLCTPRDSFDRQAIAWDLNYFKYFFLKTSDIPFDEQALEDGFQAFIDILVAGDTSHFLFRDFQARNIMVYHGKPWFIDYQGGRRGALQYDLASILFQAKAAIDMKTRMDLVEHYLDALSQHLEVDRESFRHEFFSYTLVRNLQTLGSYGFRGIFKRKTHFLDSIPYGLDNLRWLLDHGQWPDDMEPLISILRDLLEAPKLVRLSQKWESPESLTVRVSSFSYKEGLPEDPSGNGGGFYFDCRAIHNPGRYQPYKQLTGRDQPVIDFLLAESTIEAFLANVKATIEPSVEMYLERGFTHLMISFGCTGGQHRSVYCADQMAAHLQKRYGVNVILEHIVQERKNWVNEQ